MGYKLDDIIDSDLVDSFAGFIFIEWPEKQIVRIIKNCGRTLKIKEKVKREDT